VTYVLFRFGEPSSSTYRPPKLLANFVSDFDPTNGWVLQLAVIPLCHVFPVVNSVESAEAEGAPLSQN